MYFLNFFSLSPLDGRYFNKVKKIRVIFSEFNFILQRLKIEIIWLQTLSLIKFKKFIFSKKINIFLKKIIKNFNIINFKEIKFFEKKTKHDIKAIEYWLKYKFKKNLYLNKYSEFIHFSCTSEDINNIAYALMIKKTINNIFHDKLLKIIIKFRKISFLYADIPMLSKTHGQSATPTTLGKEISIFIFRLKNQIKKIKNIKILSKINGAVGNYNAHFSAYPNFNWIKFTKYFIEKKMNLFFNLYTTQIESHDSIIEIFNILIHINNILINFNRDIWHYISLKYFKQKNNKKEIGSSTMPHKINPIFFENSEGNLGVSNALLNYFTQKLPISRLQRDLTDSTVLRNIGIALGYSLISYKNIIIGLKKININKKKITNDLLNAYEILSEPIQIILKKYKIKNSYNKLKKFTKNKKISKKKLKKFIYSLKISEKIKKKLLKLKILKYIGKSKNLALKI